MVSSAVTLSRENGPSRSRPCLEPCPASSDAQPPAWAPRRPHPSNALYLLGAGWL
jgi:hypothetical protein